MDTFFVVTLALAVVSAIVGIGAPYLPAKLSDRHRRWSITGFVVCGLALSLALLTFLKGEVDTDAVGAAASASETPAVTDVDGQVATVSAVSLLAPPPTVDTYIVSGETTARYGYDVPIEGCEETGRTASIAADGLFSLGELVFVLDDSTPESRDVKIDVRLDGEAQTRYLRVVDGPVTFDLVNLDGVQEINIALLASDDSGGDCAALKTHVAVTGTIRND